MAPLVEWAIQILLGSTSTTDSFLPNEPQSQITHQTYDKPATTQASGPIGVTAVSWGYDRVDVYAGPFADGSLGHKYWNGLFRDDGDPWHWYPLDDYENIGGSLKGPPLAISWGPDRNDIFAVGRDNQLWHKALIGSTWDPSPSEWHNLGGNLSSKYPLAAASRGVDRLDVFGVREENDGGKSLWHKSWNGSSWLPSELGFEQLTGRFSTAPAVVSRLPDELSLFIVDRQKNLLHRHLDRKNKWNQWDKQGNQLRSAPVAVSRESGRFDVFGVNFDGTLHHLAYGDGKWSEWENLGGAFVDTVSIAVVSIFNTVLVGQNADGCYYWKGLWVGSPAGREWSRKGGSFASPPAIASDAEWRVDYFGIGLDGALLHQRYDDGHWVPSFDGWETLSGRTEL